MNRELTFTSLEEDVLSEIIDWLALESRESVRTLRCASRFCKLLADPTLYRHVELHDDKNGTVTKATAYKVRRLLDRTDTFSDHVRELRLHSLAIFDQYHRTGLNDVSDLERILKGLSFLVSFTWSLNKDIPKSILDILEQRWPDLKLKVSNHNRPTFNSSLLATSLLHSLRVNVTPGNIDLYQPLDKHLKMSELKEVLVQTPRLQKLNIYFSEGALRRERANDLSLLQLPLDVSDRLPSLHELTISGHTDMYEWDLRHCELLRQCMDWSHLRQLDLGVGCPEHLFDQVGPHLYNLRSFKMGASCEKLGPIIQILHNHRGLQELDITDLNSSTQILVPVILDHQTSLQRLSYRSVSYPRREHLWTMAQLRELRDQCPKLSHLEIDFLLVDQKWPYHYANTVCSFQPPPNPDG